MDAKSRVNVGWILQTLIYHSFSLSYLNLKARTKTEHFLKYCLATQLSEIGDSNENSAMKFMKNING